jgi:hypothetical protein
VRAHGRVSGCTAPTGLGWGACVRRTVHTMPSTHGVRYTRRPLHTMPSTHGARYTRRRVECAANTRSPGGAPGRVLWECVQCACWRRVQCVCWHGVCTVLAECVQSVCWRGVCTVLAECVQCVCRRSVRSVPAAEPTTRGGVRDDPRAVPRTGAVRAGPAGTGPACAMHGAHVPPGAVRAGPAKRVLML